LAFGFELSQHEYRVLAQKKQLPQDIVNGTTMRSPTCKLLTPLPTSVMMPMNSWPMMSPDSIVGM